jgi:hypothetical protein
MATISDHVSITATLQTATSPVASFDQLFLAADTADVPHDQRYITTTKSAYTDDLTSGTDAYNFASEFFAQDRTADSLSIGFWAETAQENFVVCPDLSTTVASWNLKGATAYYKLTENVTTEEMTVSGLDADTTMVEVLAALNASLAGTFAAYAWSVDPLGRYILTSDNTGASAATVTITAGTTGTDVSDLIGISTSYHVAGLDAETPAQALTAISDIYDDYYFVCYRGSNGTGSGAAVEQLALSTAVQSLNKMLVLVSTDANCKLASGDTSSIAYGTSNADHKRTMVIFTEHTTDFVDGAIQGLIIPADEGTVNWAWEPLTGVNESGLAGDGSTAEPLTNTERTALEAKNCNWLERISGSTFLYPGITADDIEMRLMVGRDWFVFGIQGDIFADMLNSNLNAFDNATLAKFEGIVREWLDVALERRIIVDTEDRPITVDFPDADDFTAAQRASHTMTLSDVFTAYLNSAVNDVTITGTFVI